jgi:hypothetical protein
MTASSIAQYLEQRRTARPAERGDPRRDAWAALASRSVAQEDSSTPAFRPLPFKAASASDAAGFPPLRQGSALFRPREAPPVPPVDIEERLAEAYHRGVQEGIDAARAEAATARAMERADIQKRAVVERVDFQMNEYAKLAEAIGQGLKDIERRIANSVEQILRPFLYATLASRAVDELVSNIQKLATAGSAPLMRVSGPEPLLKLLKERLHPFAVEVEFAAGEGAEIKVEAVATTIVTEFGPWLEWLDSVNEPA